MAGNRGVAHMGPGTVEVQSIDFPKLALGNRKCEHGVILKIVATNICGSDQHMVRGRTTAPKGLILGHEITGEVIEAGRDVEFISAGDLVSVPFNSLMQVTRAGGALGIPGLYVTEDPGAVDDAAKTGNLSIRLGLGWAKSLSFTTGQCPVLKYNRQLMQAILYDKIKIAKAVNVTVITLDDAPQGYKDFDKGAAKKFVIGPHGAVARN